MRKQKNYPFDFEFRIRYQISGDELSTEYIVSNTGSATLLFSVGGHPAFRLPLTTNTVFSDYHLKFEEMENLPRWPISKDGLILPQPISMLEDTNRLNLNKSLFYQDALVFKYPGFLRNLPAIRKSATRHPVSNGRISFSGYLVR